MDTASITSTAPNPNGATSRSISLTSTRPRRRPRNRTTQEPKSVTFAPRAQATIIPNLKSMTKTEKRRIWQSSHKQKADQNDMVDTIRQWRKGRDIPFDDADMCTRGLECLLDNAVHQRKRQWRNELIDAVLDAQEIQWQKGNLHADPEVIRQASVVHSRASAQIAAMLAEQDAIEAKALHRQHQQLTSKTTTTTTATTTTNIKTSSRHSSRSKHLTPDEITNSPGTTADNERTAPLRRSRRRTSRV